MTAIEKRRNFIINTFYTLIIVGLFCLFVKYAFWLLAPFIFALLLAMLLQGPVDFVAGKTKARKGLVSTALVLLAVFGVGTVVGLVLTRIFTELKGFFQFLVMKMENASAFIAQVRDWLYDLLHFLPQGLTDSVVQSAEGFLTKLLGSGAVAEAAGVHAAGGFDLSLLSSPLGAIWGTAKQIPLFAVSVLVAIVSACFMTADYQTIRTFTLAQAGKKAPTLVRTKRLIFQTVGKMAKAYGLILFVTFVELMIGLTILKAVGLFAGGYIFAIALVTALIDIVPVLGTGTVLIPWALWLLLTGKLGLGVGLIVIYAVITVIRQIIEPKLVASQLGLPAFVTLMAMYIGTQLFGVLGLFLLPLTIMILKVLNDEEVIRLYKKVPSREGGAAGPDTDEKGRPKKTGSVKSGGPERKGGSAP